MMVGVRKINTLCLAIGKLAKAEEFAKTGKFAYEGNGFSEIIGGFSP